MKKSKKFLAVVLSLFLVLGCFMTSPGQPAKEVSAATVKINYTYKKKKKTYTGKRRQITYAGKTVSLSQTPPFVIDRYNMAPYYETFVKGSIKAKKTYSSKTKSLTISGNGHVVKLTVDSRTAYVDGKKTTLGTAPRIITYPSSKKTRILVPVKPVANALGLTYSYSS